MSLASAVWPLYIRVQIIAGTLIGRAGRRREPDRRPIKIRKYTLTAPCKFEAERRCGKNRLPQLGDRVNSRLRLHTTLLLAISPYKIE
jgi:hypothetical protein